MRALTLHQPYASLIAIGAKTIETRGHPAPRTIIGHRIAIHAGKNRSTLAGIAVDETHNDDPTAEQIIGTLRHAGLNPDTLPFGAVVATATLAASLPMVDGSTGYCCGPQDPACIVLDVARHRARHWWPGERTGIDLTPQMPFGFYAPGRHGYHLTDIEPVDEPVPARGMQGWWEWTP